jgi:hypothetical protein
MTEEDDLQNPRGEIENHLHDILNGAKLADGSQNRETPNPKIEFANARHSPKES